MNIFLERVDVTFRRDKNTHRPRVNKPGSRLDREQKVRKNTTILVEITFILRPQ